MGLLAWFRKRARVTSSQVENAMGIGAIALVDDPELGFCETPNAKFRGIQVARDPLLITRASVRVSG